MDIYFAAPLFSEAELQYNETVCGRLEDAGHSAFLPQRDGFELASDAAVTAETDEEGDALQSIFDLDHDEVLNADIVTAVLDGMAVDEGVAVELGIAHENDIPIVGLKTDTRCFAENESLNAMVYGVLDELVESGDEFVETVNAYEEE